VWRAAPQRRQRKCRADAGPRHVHGGANSPPPRSKPWHPDCPACVSYNTLH
jgi:hypothetical protein